MCARQPKFAKPWGRTLKTLGSQIKSESRIKITYAALTFSDYWRSGAVAASWLMNKYFGCESYSYLRVLLAGHAVWSMETDAQVQTWRSARHCRTVQANQTKPELLPWKQLADLKKTGSPVYQRPQNCYKWLLDHRPGWPFTCFNSYSVDLNIHLFNTEYHILMLLAPNKEAIQGLSTWNKHHKQVRAASTSVSYFT